MLYTVYPAMSPSIFRRIVIPISDKLEGGIRLFFVIVSRNGRIEQDLFIRKKTNNYSVAYKVVRYPPFDKTLKSKQLFELKKHIDANFPVHELPKNSSGMGSWTSNTF